MNISYKWLKEYVDFGQTPEELSAALTSLGLETGSVEEVESIRGGLKGIVIGRVLTCEPHPDSDHLHVTTVDLGQEEPVQIVCGAPNVAAGQTVVVATVGTSLYDGDKEFKIKKSKIRGVESFGMICAEDEIGVGTSHDGIIVIDDAGLRPGMPASDYYNLTSDYVLEVDLTPNRIDAASHYGVARDLNAWLGVHGQQGNLRRPEVSDFALDNADGGITVEVLNPELCTRYSGVTIRGVKVEESPQWLKDRLSTIGVRPINNVVDITNYLLHGMGQPLHCFDADKIAGGKVVVRTAEPGRKFVTLDEVERTLDAADLMICNEQEPMCIAGVFGGLDSGVTEATKDIFLESACFNPTAVRKTARRHGLSTDSSFRFERGVDPNGTLYVLKLAALMVREIAGGRIEGPLVDVYPVEVKPYEVEFDYAAANALIGEDMPRETVDRILDLLEIERGSEIDADRRVLRVPTYRYDVRRQCDVVEEVLRVYGYNNIAMSMDLRASLSWKTLTDIDVEQRERVSDFLSALGFNEIMNNSLTSVRYYEDNSLYPLEKAVKLLNPLSSDLGVMRQTLFFGGMESIVRNVNRKNPDLAFYEIGNVYSRNPEKESTTDKPLAPFADETCLGLWMTGNLRQTNWVRPAIETTFFDLKAIVEQVLAMLGLNRNEIVMTQQGGDHLLKASLSIATRNGKALGVIGIVNRAMLKQFDLKQEVVYASLRWDELMKLTAKRNVTFTPLARTLPVNRDLALLIDRDVTMDRIEAVIRKSERSLLRSVELFDVYEGDKLPEGKKSYAVSITLQDDEKTLQDKQIDAVMSKIVANLQRELGAQLR